MNYKGELFFSRGYDHNFSLESLSIQTVADLSAVDSIERCVRLIETKKQKFIIFREACLQKFGISALGLQKLVVGKSFMLAVQAAKLYTREMNSAISWGFKLQSKITRYSSFPLSFHWELTTR